jgi:hypothetical protein
MEKGTLDKGRVPYPEHPERCQAIVPTTGQQCFNFRAPESQFCMAHGGAHGVNKANAAALRNYRLTKWRDSVARHANSNFVKDLRDEVGILRVLLEERLNECTTNVDLMIQSSAISDLVLKVNTLVTSCNKLEHNLGQLWDLQQITSFAESILAIISTHIKDEESLAAIAEAITNILENNHGNDD